ncbi:MAG: tRNA 2-thiocytidine(32) synthetase TtcA [Deltaproteobacteria bacterium]|nr:tRNA 2-thiocytidine(32) synthetase TtcA [Deltaproteobacteria bacterium]MBW1930160.1 tRNA 2-thiocytidine(32) synthetase TtcA [Deltaproteobacteria bacterium]MBW2024902.1 tRNA 2-thiocytidine(32) synthetase TtcA [Deltaproteobacteria bacterium]MBW2124932.1 tRNA 2-thiocytidine(32) synthetase TtcA [Deltaproteobacteria bacterium]RLB20032.1 MAG: tRNA 2-thiocytidine(32) synthetase TtcA [Deltaproteobacteria bacterium]
MSYAAKRIRHLMGKAIHSHNMIRDGEHVLVGVSGGKDSLALLWLLRERLKRVPISYEITAVHVDLGFGVDTAGPMEEFFKTHGFSYKIVKTDIGLKAHGPENRENPCFLCSRLRKKCLFELARELGITKIAMGHHKDDLIETFFLNVFYGASISTLLPVQEFFGGRIKIVRPFYLVDESLIHRYAKEMHWPQIDPGCPTAVSSTRRQIKNLLHGLYRSNKKIKGNIFHALQNVRLDYLPTPGL